MQLFMDHCLNRISAESDLFVAGSVDACNLWTKQLYKSAAPSRAAVLRTAMPRSPPKPFEPMTAPGAAIPLVTDDVVPFTGTDPFIA